MRPILVGCLGLFSIVFLLLSYLTTLDVSLSLSPQGCRMSWMNPTYVAQRGFDISWTPLAQRYSLWLYREEGMGVQWDSDQVRGTPVLFIPGNAGSSRQVRSIASSATRQFYSSPRVVSPEFASRSLKPLDFYAVEFNEDLSAFHGPTLESQIKYTSRAVDYILSLYPANTTIILMGHSMGGIVATSLLPSPKISTIITMSTPHTLPPARFDSRIDDIYRTNKQLLDRDPTPIISLCGGATDMMIPSESCILLTQGENSSFRHTVFTSALEGAWTGVGHREMVWCHQVRWRIARAALEIGAFTSLTRKGVILDQWLRDGHTIPPAIPGKPTIQDRLVLSDPLSYEVLPENIHLTLREPRGSRIYLLPVPGKTSPLSRKVIFYVSQGSIPPVSPQHPISIQVTIFSCTSSSILGESVPTCNPLEPTLLRLIPNPTLGTTFPVPNQGSDESEGVVLYEADVPTLDEGTEGERWVGVRVMNADGNGWVVGGFASGESVINTSSMFSLLFGGVYVLLPDTTALRTHFSFPNLLSNALVVYRVTPRIFINDPTCADPLLSPLILHTSQPSETHYFPINALNHRILLHTHYAAPYIPLDSPSSSYRALEFSIYSSGTGCQTELHGFTIHVDWSATLARCASRYPTTLISWAAGVVAIIIFGAWHASDKGGAVPTVQESLAFYCNKVLRKLLLVSFLVSFVPLPTKYYLGSSGELFLAPIAPLLLLVASGLVCISWWVLTVLMMPIGRLKRWAFGRRREDVSVHRSTVISMLLIFSLIFFFIPWQVAYLGCWLIHLYTCASLTQPDSFPGSSLTSGVVVIPLIRVQDTDVNTQEELPAQIHADESQGVSTQYQKYRIDNRNHSMHILLLMTWLLPLVAPVLAVWVRTLVTAGFTTPFDGDHAFLNVAPFLILVDFASWNTGPLFEQQSFEEGLSVRWSLAFIAGAAFFMGPRHAYGVFDAAKTAIGLIIVVRIGRRYWGGTSWSARS